ncbi:hypothetical protein OK349_17340 [Sphingomonas sp. BT-65]|uniref:hypothetical protein n=1 Tax=Sphingomonas sp. BT-65 TaxID=2989821 RepID=UPI002235C71D|nr:hypothetical protein [Sphingomonas sp. BT-65]MCW4463475.1 hypothetical protein [Sphingomonas sp. BT-65]
MLFYAAIKDAIADDTGLGNTILHIHAGMLILLVARLISGRSLPTFVPFAAVLALELANEGIDRVNHGTWRWVDTTGDMVSTLFWPFVLSLATRLRPIRESASPPEAGNRD